MMIRRIHMRTSTLIIALMIVSLLISGCSDLLLQLSDNGEMKIQLYTGNENSLSLTPEGVIELESSAEISIHAQVDPPGDYTYRWYIDGARLLENDSAQLLISGKDHSLGTHSLIVGVDINSDILVQEVDLIISGK
jgi:ABC-type Fe3+-hydroxamate transport system substrate-binding protein